MRDISGSRTRRPNKTRMPLLPGQGAASATWPFSRRRAALLARDSVRPGPCRSRPCRVPGTTLFRSWHASRRLPLKLSPKPLPFGFPAWRDPRRVRHIARVIRAQNMRGRVRSLEFFRPTGLTWSLTSRQSLRMAPERAAGLLAYGAGPASPCPVHPMAWRPQGARE